MSHIPSDLFRSVPTNEPSSQKADTDEPKTCDVSTISTSSCDFYQIRRRFEDKSKDAAKLRENEIIPPLVKEMSEFQKLYPHFICNFTKRQFSEMEKAFDEADNNQDGFLEAKEVKQLFANHKHQVNLCNADSIVKMGDKDNDRKLSPKEFLELCTPAVEAVRDSHLTSGSPLPTGQDFVHAVLQRVRDLANPIEKNVQGKRRHFEQIISGKDATTTEEKDKLWQINKFERNNN